MGEVAKRCTNDVFYDRAAKTHVQGKPCGRIMREITTTTCEPEAYAKTITYYVCDLCDTVGRPFAT